ncbi:MAG: PAS domain S-box protein [Candidatus Hodarchaeota archaeon]
MTEDSRPANSTDTSKEELLRYRALVDSMNEGFGVVDERNVFTYVNKRFSEMLLYTQEEMVGRRLQDFLDSANKEVLEQNIKKRSVGLASRYELAWLSKDGDLVSTIVSGAPLVDEDGIHRGSFAVITDIRERQRLEKAVRDSEANYRAMAESSLQGITVIQNNQYVYVNQAFAEIVGISVAEIMRMPSEEQWSLIHPDDREFLLKLAEDRNEGRPVPTTYDYRFQRRDGNVRWVQAFSSKIVYDGESALQVFIIDITEKHKAEEALRESEAKYRAVTEQSLQAVAIMQDEGIAYANPAYAELVGVPIETLMEYTMKQIWDIIYLEDRGRLRERFQKYWQSKELRPRTSYRIQRPNGEIRWVDSYVSILEFSGKPAMQTVLIDVTDQLRAEENLRASQRMLELVMNSIPTYISWKDTVSTYLGCNENFARVAGVESPAQIVGKSDFDLAWTEEEAQAYRIADGEVIENDTPRFREVESQLQADGKQAWLETNRVPLHDADGGVIGILVTHEDITERVAKEEAIRKSEIKYRTLAEQSLQAITILSDDGLEYVNKTFSQMVDYPVEELIEMDMEKVWSLFHPADQPILRDRIAARRAGKPVPARHEYRLVRHDGEILWVEAYATRVEFNNKPALQTVLIDTTSRRKAEREVRAAKDRAMLYLDLMGHDIRNQLQVILNGVALLRTASDENTRESFYDVVQDAISRCSRLIEEVKSTEQLLVAQLVERDLTIATEGCIRALVSEDVMFDTSFEINSAPIKADDFLELLISNILMNAVEHNTNSPKRVWVRISENDQGYILSIGDNGPGIVENRKHELFDMSRRYGGVGLHQSNQILEKYGGRIKVTDRVPGKPSEGAEFRIWFPKLPQNTGPNGDS